MTFDHAALAQIAKAERERRATAWRDMLAKGRANREQAEADQLLWLEIEMQARSYAGDAEARRYALQTPFAKLAKNARATLNRACASISDDDANGCRKIRDLWHLTRWLERCAVWTAPIAREPELILEKAA